MLRGGKPVASLAQEAQESAQRRRAAAGGDDRAAAKARAREAVETLPAVPRIDRAVAHCGVVALAEKIGDCVRHAEEAAAFQDAGRRQIRNPRLFLMASDHLRRSLDTAIRLQGMVTEMADVEQFHRAIFNALEAAAPEAAEKALAAMQRVSSVCRATIWVRITGDLGEKV